MLDRTFEVFPINVTEDGNVSGPNFSNRMLTFFLAHLSQDRDDSSLKNIQIEDEEQRIEGEWID